MQVLAQNVCATYEGQQGTPLVHKTQFKNGKNILSTTRSSSAVASSKRCAPSVSCKLNSDTARSSVRHSLRLAKDVKIRDHRRCIRQRVQTSVSSERITEFLPGYEHVAKKDALDLDPNDDLEIDLETAQQVRTDYGYEQTDTFEQDDFAVVHPDWFYADEIPIPTDKVMSGLLSEILRERVPLEALFAKHEHEEEQALSGPAYMSLLVAIGRARHWKQVKAVFQYMLERLGDSPLPSSFFMHLAYRRVQEQQYLPALEVFEWYRAKGDPPSAASMELFIRLSTHAMIDGLDIHENESHISLSDWYRSSDVGRVFWEKFVDQNGGSEYW